MRSKAEASAGAQTRCSLAPPVAVWHPSGRPGDGGTADVERRKVAVEQLVDGRVRPRVALLVDLTGEPAECFIRLSRRLRARGDDLAEVVPAPGQRVDADLGHWVKA